MRVAALLCCAALCGCSEVVRYTDELTDPRLSALKLRMTEAARPLLGDQKMRQLVLDNIDADVL